METMLLHIEQPNTQASGGVIYVTVGESSFPEEGWYDLIGADFEMWLPGFISFARGHTDTWTLQFMDGPSAVRLMRYLSGRIYAVCLWNQKTELQQAEIDFRTFTESVAKCIRQDNLVRHRDGRPTRFVSELSAIKTILNTYP